MLRLKEAVDATVKAEAALATEQKSKQAVQQELAQLRQQVREALAEGMKGKEIAGVTQGGGAEARAPEPASRKASVPADEIAT